MHKRIHVLLTPGIDGDCTYLETNTSCWSDKYGIVPHYYTINFRRGTNAEEQRNLYLKKVQDTKARFLIAVSGSGLLALDALKRFPVQIQGVILISARLRPGYFPVIPYVYTLLRYPIFFSYLRSHKKTLRDVDTSRVMTMSSRWDEVVPPSTVKLRGAHNFRITMRPKQWPFHRYFSRYVVTDYEKEITEFIQNTAQ